MINYFSGPLRDPAPGDGPAAGGGTGNPAAFDPAAFRTEILGELNKTLNGFAKSLKGDLGKLIPAPPTPASDPSPAPEPAHAGSNPDAALQAQFKALERQNKQFQDMLATLQKENLETKAASEMKDRNSLVRDALGAFTFGSDSQKETAFRLFSGDIKREADGNLYGPDGATPYKEYITDQMKQHSYLLAPKDVGGAGARPGGRQAGAKSIDIDAIKPGMSAADMAAASAEILALIKAA